MIRYREATKEDAPVIARLHAESWRVHYRGAYRDDYLDGDVLTDRSRVWTERFNAPPPNQFVVIAEDTDGNDSPLGFACVYGADDPHWGTLLDNIHVAPHAQNRGVGAGLFAHLIKWCRENHPTCGLYLWVLHDNDKAQRFYQRLGARDAGGEFSEPPGGGQIHGRRYVWDALPEVQTL